MNTEWLLENVWKAASCQKTPGLSLLAEGGCFKFWCRPITIDDYNCFVLNFPVLSNIYATKTVLLKNLEIAGRSKESRRGSYIVFLQAYVIFTAIALLHWKS